MESKSEKTTEIQLKTQTQKPKTRLETLRIILKDLENHIARVTELNIDAAFEIPNLFDKAEDLISDLQTRGTNLSSELGQLKTLSAQFNKVRTDFIRKIGGPTEMAEARQERQPPDDHWWWFVDRSLAEDNKRRTQRILRILGLIVVLLVVTALVYNRFFAPDPVIRASYGHQQQAENALVEGHLQEALVEVQNALSFTPEDPDLYTLLGVVQEALEQQTNARDSFDIALAVYDQPEYFYNQRTILYLMLGEPQRALEDAQTAIEINPDSAISHLQQGQAYDALGDKKKAIQSYEMADEIAQSTGNAQLQAIIRINLANTYQQFSLPTMEVEATGGTEAP